MSKPFVTVLIDTYNHEQFIEEAIQSVLGQDFGGADGEILVVDDGSTDDTPNIARKFEPTVRLLRKANGGQASAFNAGILQARGDILVFLDGDDWWAPGKLAAVLSTFAANPSVGTVGHGLTEVYSDGRRRQEVLRAPAIFRISSVAEAQKFRNLRGFLGTSRMAYRRTILQKIGIVPPVLRFEADEYLFTLAGFFGDVMILNESFTFYRLHGKNLYQISSGNTADLRKKQKVIESLAQSLAVKFKQDGIDPKIAQAILEGVETEAEVLRLMVDRGFPWETVLTEMRVMRIFHSDAPFLQHMFSFLRLLPALLLPSRTYYQWKNRLSRLGIYRSIRQKFLPFPVPEEVSRSDWREHGD